MLEMKLRPIRKVFGCFPKRAGDYRLKRYNGVSWVETSANAYNAYTNTWKPVNGYIFVNGEKCNFYGSVVDSIVSRLEARGIRMLPGISTWDDIFSNVNMVKTVLANDASVAALLDDTTLKEKAMKDSRIIAAIKNYGTYGRAALTHIKNNAALKNEFLAISGAYSVKSDFRYLLTCESCNSSGSVRVPCSKCHGYAYVESGNGKYYECWQCGRMGYNPVGVDHCGCGNSISSGYYSLYDACPSCNSDGSRDKWSGGYTSSSCTDCGGNGCHF